METEVQFRAGSRTFDEVAALVAQKEIKLEPLVRITNEKYPGSTDSLPEGFIGKDFVDINGVLWFKQESFTFTFHRVASEAATLQVDVGDQNLITANQLVEALNTILPTTDTLPIRIASTSTKAVWNRLGCLFILLVISACVFFFGYGVYRFFMPQLG